jgi:hypothetical protein
MHPSVRKDDNGKRMLHWNNILEATDGLDREVPPYKP